MEELIKTRMEEIEKEYDQLVSEIGRLNHKLQELNSQRLKLEGAFQELEKLYKTSSDK